MTLISTCFRKVPKNSMVVEGVPAVKKKVVGPPEFIPVRIMDPISGGRTERVGKGVYEN